MSRPLPPHFLDVESPPTSVDQDDVQSPYDNSNYICGICLEVPCSPVSLQRCPHLFCFNCIQSWHRVKISRRETPFCPVCKTQVQFRVLQQDITQFDEWAQSHKSLFNQITTSCHKCFNWTGPVSQFPGHSQFCEKRLVQCSNFQCDCQLPLDEMIDEHWQKGDKYRISCNNCYLLIPETGFQEHVSTCKKKIVVRDSLQKFLFEASQW